MTHTTTMPTTGSLIIRCDVSPAAPPEPKRQRDERGRFRKRLGVTIVQGDCGGVQWSEERR